MVDLEKEIKKEEKKVEKFFSKKENIWMSVSIVLAVVVIVLLIISVTGKCGISKDAAGEKMIAYLSTLVPAGDVVTLKNVTSLGNVYEIVVEYKSQDIPVYMTKDGKYMVQGLSEINPSSSINTNSNNQTKEVPKADKPKVQLFIWSYCPYGVQAQGPVAEVANLLKGKADFEIVTYYDGHGAYETQQNKIQSCIQKLASDKYWNYAAKFVTDIYPKCSSTRTEDCDKNESVKLMKSLGINSASVLNFVESHGTSLLSEASSKAQANGVSGSPTILINGVAVQAARTSEAIKAAVCEAFNTAPSQCSQTLSGTTAAASGSC